MDVSWAKEALKSMYYGHAGQPQELLVADNYRKPGIYICALCLAQTLMSGDKIIVDRREWQSKSFLWASHFGDFEESE